MTETKTAAVLTDVWYSRRQRLNQVIDEEGVLLFSSKYIVDTIRWCESNGYKKILLVPDNASGKGVLIDVLNTAENTYWIGPTATAQ